MYGTKFMISPERAQELRSSPNSKWKPVVDTEASLEQQVMRTERRERCVSIENAARNAATAATAAIAAAKVAAYKKRMKKEERLCVGDWNFTCNILCVAIRNTYLNESQKECLTRYIQHIENVGTLISRGQLQTLVDILEANHPDTGTTFEYFNRALGNICANPMGVKKRYRLFRK
jgi:hypothetical protein